MTEARYTFPSKPSVMCGLNAHLNSGTVTAMQELEAMARKVQRTVRLLIIAFAVPTSTQRSLLGCGVLSCAARLGHVETGARQAEFRRQVLCTQGAH